MALPTRARRRPYLARDAARTELLAVLTPARKTIANQRMGVGYGPDHGMAMTASLAAKGVAVQSGNGITVTTGPSASIPVFKRSQLCRVWLSVVE